MERGDAKRLRAGEDENGAGNEKRFEKCFLFLFGKDHDACPLRKMTTLRGEGYSYECVEHALQSYDRDSERKTKLRGFTKVPYAETNGALRVFADSHAPCVAGVYAGGGYHVVCGRLDAIGLATDYEAPAWESMREWLSQSGYNEGYDPAADAMLAKPTLAQAGMDEKDQVPRQGEAIHSGATPEQSAEQRLGPDCCEPASDQLQGKEEGKEGKEGLPDGQEGLAEDLAEDEEDLAALYRLPSVHIEGQVYYVDKEGEMEAGVKNLAILLTKEKGKIAEAAGIYDACKHVVVRFTLDQAFDLFGDDPDGFCVYLTSGGLQNAETGSALHYTQAEAQAMYDDEFV